MNRAVVDVISKNFEEGSELLDLSEGECLNDLGGDAIFSGSTVVGDGLEDIPEVVGVAVEAGVVGALGAVLDVPGEPVDRVRFFLVAVIEVGQESTEDLAPILPILPAFKFPGDFCRGRGSGGVREFPVMASSLLKRLVGTPGVAAVVAGAPAGVFGTPDGSRGPDEYGILLPGDVPSRFGLPCVWFGGVGRSCAGRWAGQ